MPREKRDKRSIEQRLRDWIPIAQRCRMDCVQFYDLLVEEGCFLKWPLVQGIWRETEGDMGSKLYDLSDSELRALCVEAQTHGVAYSALVLQLRKEGRSVGDLRVRRIYDQVYETRRRALEAMRKP